MDSVRLAHLLRDSTIITMIIKKNSLIEKHYRKLLEEHGITVIPVDFKFALSPTLVYQARKILRQQNIGNVIYFGASELKSLFFSFIGLDINLIIRHGTTKNSPKKDVFHRLIYSKVCWHVATSHHIENNIKKIMPFGRNSKSKVIYPSLRFETRRNPISSAPPNRKLELVHVGRITDAKGQTDAILACEALYLKRIPFRLRLVGEVDKSFYPQLEKILNKIDFSDSIEICGYTETPQDYLETANIFLFPSHGEGFGNAFIEALYFNLICIAYNNTVFPEFKKMGFSVLLAEHKDLDSLKAKILEACKAITQNENFTGNNKELCIKMFSKSREKSAFLKIMR